MRAEWQGVTWSSWKETKKGPSKAQCACLTKRGPIPEGIEVETEAVGMEAVASECEVRLHTF